MKVYKGFHTVEIIDCEIKGEQVKREKLGIKSAVGALVIDSKNKMALVRQLRPIANKMTYEIPAGLLDKNGLTPKEVLIEELQEECEIQRDEIISVDENPFLHYYMVIGSSDATISIYKMKVTEQQSKLVQDADVEEVLWKTLDEVKEMVENKEIIDPKTLLSINEFEKTL